jgi:hypothetical protein
LLARRDLFSVSAVPSAVAIAVDGDRVGAVDGAVDQVSGAGVGVEGRSLNARLVVMSILSCSQRRRSPQVAFERGPVRGVARNHWAISGGGQLRLSRWRNG